MSQWSRKYNNPNEDIQVSEETQRYINHLQIKSNDACFFEHSEDDDITEQLMRRIERNTNITRQPKEVRAARKVIQNWLQIENEAQYIRHHSQKHTMTKNLSISANPTITSNLRHKRVSISKRNDTKTHNKAPNLSSFDAKFARMKTKALDRQKKQKFELESYKKQIFSTHSKSKSQSKTKQITHHIFEFKEEESNIQNIQNIHNAEQKLRYDLIPSSIYNKINKMNKNKEKNVNKLETKKVLLFQLNEIEKQEKYHNKKLLIKIWSEWQKQKNKSQKIEENAINFYRNNLLKHSFISWIDYINNSKQIIINVFSEWIKMRLISQQNEIKAIQFYEYGLKDNILFNWCDYTRRCIETRKIRTMQIQTRLYKMNKISKRHYKFVIFNKIIKYWKEYTNDEQSKRFLNQQREKRKLKIQKLISSVKQRTNTSNIKFCDKINITKHSIQAQISNNNNIKAKAKAKEMRSQSIQTDTKIYNMNSNDKQQAIATKKEIKCFNSLKPSRLIISMEKRALERKEKRKQIIELKKKKEQEYKEYIFRQKQIEIEKIKERKRLKKEEKLKKLQKQMFLKEIENNKLILSQLHYKRALMIYYGWIPWMKYIEINNINYHKIILIRNGNLQKRVWRLWQSVINKRKRSKSNAKLAACIGREMICNKLFKIKIESKYCLFWKEIILKYKMMTVMIAEKRKVNILRMYLQSWKKQYFAELNKKIIRQHNNEELANKHGNLVLTKRMMIRWRKNAENLRKEKIKARTWRKVELWLTELRAKR